MKKIKTFLMAGVFTLFFIGAAYMTNALPSTSMREGPIGGASPLPGIACQIGGGVTYMAGENGLPDEIMEAISPTPVMQLASAESPCKQACSCNTQTAGEGCVACMKRSMSDDDARDFCNGWCAVNRQQACGWNSADVDLCQDAVAAA